MAIISLVNQQRTTWENDKIFIEVHVDLKFETSN